MIILCHGMVKSASSFATQIVLNIIHNIICTTGGQRIGIRHIVPEADDIFSESIDLTETILRKSTDNVMKNNELFLVIKLHHECSPYIIDRINSKNVFALSTYRNPIDIALSLIDATKIDKENNRNRFVNFNTIEDTLEAVDYNIYSFNSWAASPKTELIYFNELALDPLAVGKRIANRIGATFNQESVLSLVNNKSTIWEYNKGIVDRGKIELSPSRYKELAMRWEGFMSKLDIALD